MYRERPTLVSRAPCTILIESRLEGIVSIRKRCRVDFLSISGVGLASADSMPPSRRRSEAGAQSLSKLLEDVGRIGHVQLVREALCSSHQGCWQDLLWRICFHRVGGEEARMSALCVLASTLVQGQGLEPLSAGYMASSVDRLLSLVSHASPEWPALKFGERTIDAACTRDARKPPPAWPTSWGTL